MELAQKESYPMYKVPLKFWDHAGACRSKERYNDVPVTQG